LTILQRGQIQAAVDQPCRCAPDFLITCVAAEADC
jgi:hypothetical protein